MSMSMLQTTTDDIHVRSDKGDAVDGVALKIRLSNRGRGSRDRTRGAAAPPPGAVCE